MVSDIMNHPVLVIYTAHVHFLDKFEKKINLKIQQSKLINVHVFQPSDFLKTDILKYILNTELKENKDI